MFINIPLKGSAFTVCGKFILMGDFHWSVKGQYRGKTLGFADSGQYPVFSGARGPGSEAVPASSRVPFSLQTTASPPTTSITRSPPTCLRTPAVARHPRVQDGSLEGVLVPPPLERPPPLRRERKMRMRPVKPRVPGHSLSRLLPPHPLLCR